MGKGYSCISNVTAKSILSKFFGDSKRIPFSWVTLTIEDGLTTQIDARWSITTEDVKDHRGILQGVLVQEAASQAIVCYAIATKLFPDHSPMFLGSDHFRLHAPVRANDELHIRVTDINWRGKKGSASAVALVGDKRVATISTMYFRANSEEVLERIGTAA